MAKQGIAKQAVRYLIGTCVPSTTPNAVKIRIGQLKLDTHISKYFKHYEFVYATDPTTSANVGDTVLIQTLPSPLTRLITHKIVNVVYPLGDIVDPVTGKKVVQSQYRETLEEMAETYGKLDSMFDYEKAPPRGTMKDRDFSYQETYRQYYEDPDDPQPYAIPPF